MIKPSPGLGALSRHHIVAVNHKIRGFGQVEEPSRLSGFCCNYGKFEHFKGPAKMVGTF
jgi:hypothetical protein